MDIRLPLLPRAAALAGKINDLITTGTAPDIRQHGADVDVVELFELETVDRDDRDLSTSISSRR